MAAHPLPIPDKKSSFSKQQCASVAPRLIALLKPEIRLLVYGLLALLGGSMLNLAFPYIIKIFLDKSSVEGLSEYLTELTGILVLLFLLQGCFFYARHYFLQLTGLRVVTRLKEDLVRALLKQDISFFDTSNTGDLLSRVSADTEAVQRGLSINISVILRYSVQVLGGISLMMYLSVKLSLIIIVLIPALVLLSIYWSQKLKILSTRMQEAIGMSGIVIEEALNGIRTVKIFSAENKESRRFSESIREALSKGTERTHIAALFSSSMITILHISIALVFWFGISEVIHASLSTGDLTAFLLYCTIVAVSFGFLTNAWAEFVQSMGAAERVFEIMDQAPRDTQIATPPALNKSGFEICFREVSFTYPARPEHTALCSVSFTMHAGQTLALVGPSGSGKSTIAALIPGLYKPVSGEILLNGVDIFSIPPEVLRSHISFVPQTVHLFSASLRYNLAYGSNEYSEARLQEVITQANLSDLVERLPEGLETQLGDKGVLLSGGERQRVSIARALLRNPDILILDEATSSLDSHNEKAVQDALKNLLNKRTTLIIAHRLSTIQHADQVLVLKEGTIVQKGTHDTLMNETGLYKSMVEYQLL
jgi:ABC-type multidrug transport system fused ATPase/permease subunit